MLLFSSGVSPAVGVIGGLGTEDPNRIEPPDRRLVALDFNDYTERCVSQIATSPRCEADKILISLITLQSSCEQTSSVSPNDSLYNFESTGSPMEACIDSFRRRLRPIADAAASDSQAYGKDRLYVV